MRVGVLTHESALVHDAGRRHPERRERVEAILAELHRAGLHDRLEWAEPSPAPRELIELVHGSPYVDLLERADAAGGEQLDADTRLGPGSLDAARRGSGAAVEASAKVLAGEWDAGFSVMRPPGHHATPDRAMGFCLTNHAAVATRWAIEHGGCERVLVLDWDAHHGNGTQDIFWSDPSVLYVSLHQYPYYPGTGALHDVGEGEARWRTLNVPLPAGSAEDAYARALEELVIPVARSFAPDLTVVSAGYDAHALDPLCMMRLRAGAYFRFARTVQGLGRGPVCVLEGGYDLQGLAWSVSATLSALLGDEGAVGIPPSELEAESGEREAHRWIDEAIRVWAPVLREDE